MSEHKEIAMVDWHLHKYIKKCGGVIITCSYEFPDGSSNSIHIPYSEFICTGTKLISYMIDIGLGNTNFKIKSITLSYNNTLNKIEHLKIC